MSVDNITYIYAHTDGHIEVELTGRKSKRNLEAIGTAPSRDDYLVEIKPVKIQDGRWTKFVRYLELSEIFEDE